MRLLGWPQALSMVLWSLAKLAHHPGQQVPRPFRLQGYTPPPPRVHSLASSMEGIPPRCTDGSAGRPLAVHAPQTGSDVPKAISLAAVHRACQSPRNHRHNVP
jgi:hypothetical protein